MHATENDIPFLADVERSGLVVFRVFPDHDIGGPTMEVVLLQKMVAARKLWVAVTEQDEPVGFMACREIDGFLYIHEFIIAHDFQKQGIGRRFMQIVLKDAEQSGYPAIGLTTRRDAIWNGPFYKSFGFAEITGATEWPGLFAELQREIGEGANPDVRCAMIKTLAD